jgi:hypothetical protein
VIELQELLESVQDHEVSSLVRLTVQLGEGKKVQDVVLPSSKQPAEASIAEAEGMTMLRWQFAY